MRIFLAGVISPAGPARQGEWAQYGEDRSSIETWDDFRALDLGSVTAGSSEGHGLPRTPIDQEKPGRPCDVTERDCSSETPA
jgi:hypothetical protein